MCVLQIVTYMAVENKGKLQQNCDASTSWRKGTSRDKATPNSKNQPSNLNSYQVTLVLRHYEVSESVSVSRKLDYIKKIYNSAATFWNGLGMI